MIRSHQAPFPFTSSLSISYILRAADKLLRAALVGTGTGTGTAGAGGGGGGGGHQAPLRDDSPVGPYSNMMLSFSGLERLEEGQRGIEGFFAAQQARANAAAATARGAGAVKRGGEELDGGGEAREEKRRRKDKGKKRRDVSREATIEVLPDGTEALVLSSSSSSSSSNDNNESAPRRTKRPRAPTYTCPRCARVLVAPDAVVARGEDEAVREALEREKAEHADWHVARDLAGALVCSFGLAAMASRLTAWPVRALAETERKENGWSLGGSTKPSPATGAGAKAKTGTSSSSSMSKKKETKGASVPSKRGKKEKKEEGTLNGFFRRAS